ncbi:hypothetical protein PDIDSM_832 [Penicillium digitatum]|nr:hypothetical protein PDIDSM_832 [Penicillium digitatum]
MQNDLNHPQQTEITQQSPLKLQKISEPGAGSAAGKSALERGQTTPLDAGMPSGSRPSPPLCGIPPTMLQDEMELRCNLTTEINVQRMKHRNLAAGPLRNIVKLLMKARAERPAPESKIDGSSAMPLSDEWREEDDLMEVATVKLEKGGRCSRALLSRFENFLYGPLMSSEEKKMQERIMCVEECLSSASAPPTSDHNYLFLHRLKRIILHPDAYGLDEKDSRIGFLCNQLLAAIATNSKLTPSNRKKFAELLDPDGEIANVSADNPGVKAETPISTRKASPKPTSARVHSSHTTETPSRTMATRQKSSVTSLSPSPPHPPPLPSRSSTLSLTSIESIDLTDDAMSSSSPFIVKRTPKKHVASDSQSSQSNNTASSSMEPLPKKRPASDGQSNDMIAPAPKRAASGRRSSNLNNIIAPPHKRSASRTQSSQPNYTIPQVPKPVSSSSQSLNSEAPKKLWSIFLLKCGLLLPALDLDQLTVSFNVAVNHGKLAPNVIDPILGFCLAVASHLTLERSLWEGRKWNDAALSTLRREENTPSLQYFHRRILQIEYVHMVGYLEKGWEILSLAISKAKYLQMHTMHGGCLAVDKKSLEQVRVIWQSLWMKKLSLALQLGIVNQYLDVFHFSPMPMQSQMQETMEIYGGRQSFVASSFFIASATLLKNTDDLISVENNLRVTRMECPIKWFSTLDLRPFQDLNESLSSWNNCLPNCLEWKGATVEFAIEKDPIVRRMSLLAHVRYAYFRLRQHRPFLILALRLSNACACENNPHMTGKEMDSINSSLLLALVYHGAIKCLTAAQDVVKTLSISYEKENDDHAKCEQLDYLYASGLVLIAAMRIPCLMDGTQHCASPTAAVDRSISMIAKDLRRVEQLLRCYQERCEQATKLKLRVQRCRDAIAIIRLQSVSSDCLITDHEITFHRNVWLRIYDRLGLDLPFPRFCNGRAANDKSAGRRMTFGWLESLPFDLDSQGE